MARLLLGPDMSVQAPPNLNPGRLAALVDAGINDWGGVSPLTPDHVNPESPWPHLDQLAEEMAAAGKLLVERGLCDSRTRAQALILAGEVVVGDHAVTKPGTAVDAEVAQRGGAYAGYGVVTILYSGALLHALYKVGALRFRGARVYTNLPPCGAMRGHGAVNVRFAF